MKRFMLASMALFALGGTLCFAQASGNIAYSGGGGIARPDVNERTKRIITREDMPPTSTSMFVEANVLMNVKADEFVAVFAITQEGSTIAECGQKLDATIQGFSESVKQLGIAPGDSFVDFVAQNKIYAYEVSGDIAKEKVAGFEIKKNFSIHYKDKALLDKLLLAASKAQIFDLVKVDYIVKVLGAIQDKLMEAAAAVIRQKTARYERLLDIKLRQPAQVYAERPSVYYPSELYDSYAAFESEDVSGGSERQKYTVQNARKTRSFFFNGVGGRDFDRVINPVIVGPVVQFTLYLKMKYELQPNEAGIPK